MLSWVSVFALFFVAGLLSLGWFERSHERRQDRPRRSIKVVAAPKVIRKSNGDCPHRRSRKHARRRDGSTVSVCKFCGQPMKRVCPGHWELVDAFPKEQ
jgi:hypothetical protein